MLKHVVALALEFRLYVLLGAAILMGFCLMSVTQLEVDVLPDMNRPYVTIMVEAHGFTHCPKTRVSSQSTHVPAPNTPTHRSTR